MANFTIEEQIACYIARSFNPDDDFAVLATGPCGLVGLALAKELYAPRLSLLGHAKSRFAVMRQYRFPFMPGNPPPELIETLLTMDDVFALVVRGKYFIIMQPVQVDQNGYMNLSMVGDKFKPAAVFVGSRNVPDNTVNQPRTLYFVPNHNRRVFVEKVDFISGVGYGKERREGIAKWGAPIEILSNLCAIDFDPETGKARLKSVHTGVTVEHVQANTGFDLIIPEPLPGMDPPTDTELRHIRDEIDPLGVRRLDFVRGEEYKNVMAEIMSGGKR